MLAHVKLSVTTCSLLQPPWQRLIFCESGRQRGEHLSWVPSALESGVQAGSQPSGWKPAWLWPGSMPVRGICLSRQASCCRGRRQPAPGPGLPKQPWPEGGHCLASFSGQTRLLCVGLPCFLLSVFVLGVRLRPLQRESLDASQGSPASST